MTVIHLTNARLIDPEAAEAILRQDLPPSQHNSTSDDYQDGDGNDVHSRYQRYSGNALVIDKWFTLQALSLHPDVIAQVRALAEHPDFTLRNPNRVRSLYMAFAGNPQGFHAADGSGYRMIADVILTLDPVNPQTAAKFVPSLGRWRRLEPGRAALMKGELERIMAAGNLSRDTFEQVSRSLEG